MCNVGYWYDEWFQRKIDLIKGYDSSWMDNLHSEEQPVVELYEDYKEVNNGYKEEK